MLTPQGWIDNGTVVFEDNIITNAGEGKAPIEGAFRTIVLKAGIPLAWWRWFALLARL